MIHLADNDGKFEMEFANDGGGMNWICISGLQPYQKIRCIKQEAK